MNDRNTHFYSKQAEQLCHQYDQLSFTQVHQHWLAYLPSKGQVLDIGAGSGRDARYLASRGLDVVAVEPSNGMREIAQRQSDGLSINWLDDRLPELPNVAELKRRFDLILLSAVWMHIPVNQRHAALRSINSLLAPNGKVVISLRHGDSPDERKMYPVSAEEIKGLATEFGLTFKLLEQQILDQLGREQVHWQTVVLSLKNKEMSKHK